MADFLDTPRPAYETTEAVFEALLQAWREGEQSIIGEHSSNFDADGARADREMERWRERFRSTINY